ncbi:hypothetical protein VDG1235_2585 [Verrucomicrobiia bacterium DG1235]|nr:hypothetical protein VDG1235_2585 [Verrucomicrobiae bacterium DG1235]
MFHHLLNTLPAMKRKPKLAIIPFVALASVLLSSCANVSISQQGLVSKPNVALDDQSAFLEDSVLVGQTEPGSGTGGNAAGGCVSCK